MRLAAAIAALLAGVAHADAPDAVVARALVLADHEVAVAVTAEASLARDGYRTPLSVAPDLWFGVTARWTVGVITSDATIDRIGTGAGMALDGNASRGGGVDVRWSWLAGELAIAPRARVLVRELAPIEPAVTLGALVRWTRGPFAISSDPYARVGLGGGALDPPAIVLPVWLEVQPGRGWSVALHTGWGSSLPVIANAWHVPLGLDLRVRATASLDLALEAGFTSWLGPDDRRAERSVAFGVGWHR